MPSLQWRPASFMTARSPSISSNTWCNLRPTTSIVGCSSSEASIRTKKGVVRSTLLSAIISRESSWPYSTSTVGEELLRSMSTIVPLTCRPAGARSNNIEPPRTGRKCCSSAISDSSLNSIIAPTSPIAVSWPFNSQTLVRLLNWIYTGWSTERYLYRLRDDMFSYALDARATSKRLIDMYRLNPALTRFR